MEETPEKAKELAAIFRKETPKLEENSKVLKGTPEMEEAKDLAAIFRQETPKQEEAEEMAIIFNAESPHDTEEMPEVQKKTMDLFTMFLDKVKAQKKAMDLAIILNAENPRAGIPVVEEQKKAVELIASFNAETKEMLEVQKKAMDLVVNFKAEIPHNTREEFVQEHPHPSSRPLPWLPNGSPPNTSPSIQTTKEVEKMEPDENQDEEVVKVREENPKSWRPGLAKLTGLTEEPVQEHLAPAGRPCPGYPVAPLPEPPPSFRPPRRWRRWSRTRGRRAP